MTEAAPNWPASADVDGRVRTAAFAFLREQTKLHTDLLPWSVLSKGFQFEGQRVPLLGPQGIFKPAVLAKVPLTIATAPEIEGRPRPYEDSFSAEGVLRYRYRGVDRHHRDNVGLRTAMEQRLPLIYLYGVVRGQYLPVWPVYVVADDPNNFTFNIELDAAHLGTTTPTRMIAEPSDARKYVVQLVNRRIHQQSFRAKVLRAYQERCSLCRIRHTELLDAAHILPDGHPRGLPIVPNGLALCKLHHAAFDANILGVRPDLIVEVRKSILDETDGPMLLHGLKDFQGSRLQVPHHAHNRPERINLEERYESFRKAG
jgi:putative restriction endonuclease